MTRKVVHDLLHSSARTGRELGRQTSHAKAGSSGRSALRLWTRSQTTDSSSWAAHWVMERRSSCSLLLPKVSKPSRSCSRTILGRLCGCCARHRSSAGKSFWVLASNEQPHGCKDRCASRGLIRGAVHFFARRREMVAEREKDQKRGKPMKAQQTQRNVVSHYDRAAQDC